MAEQRLIDANEARKSLLSYYSFVNENTSKSNYTGETLMSYEVADMIEDCIENATTIDPETLPVVCQLRAELDNLRKEKRPTSTLVKSTFGVCCSRCKTECSPQWVACPVCGAEIKKEDANE